MWRLSASLRNSSRYSERVSFPAVRMRRLRKPSIRNLLTEIISPSNLVYPIFVEEKITDRRPINAMPGQFRQSLKTLVDEVEEVISLGIPSVFLFGIPSNKNESGSSAHVKNGVIQKATKLLKSNFGDSIVIITDVCLCEYTSHGHCGIIRKGQIMNDETLDVLAKIAVSHAESGVDVVAPSSMMDGQVSSIRKALDEEGLSETPIISYSAKFASSFYGPFREAADSKPSFGDRRGYQMNYASINEALREVELDINEGADIVMVKPALAYLDVINAVKMRFLAPLAAFNVSGEYSMVKLAAKQGWLKEKDAVLEVLTAIKRAGADIIITYHAKDATKWLKER